MGKKMKENIFLYKDKIKIKGNEKKVMNSLHPREGRPWDEFDDEDAYVQILYQIIKKNKDKVKPKKKMRNLLRLSHICKLKLLF